MSNDDETCGQEPLGDDSETDPNSLESAQSYVAASAGAGQSGDGSGQAFTATFSALVDWGEARALIRTESELPFFTRVPDAQGNEHEVWFVEESNRWFKATYRNQFGLAWGRDGTATPFEYLTRLLLQNRFFGDDIKLVALIQSRQQLRILTSQPHIAGDSASATEIQQWFIGLHFVRVESDKRVAWYRRYENLLVADAHEGNVIKTTGGDLVPIDLNILQPCGDLFAWTCSKWEAARG